MLSQQFSNVSGTLQSQCLSSVEEMRAATAALAKAGEVLKTTSRYQVLQRF